MTRTDLIVSAICVTSIAALATAVIGQDLVKNTWERDGTHLKEIHQSLAIFGREFGGGGLMVPGLIRRKPINGMHIPGRGEEDVTQNTTAAIYASLIMQNYVSPKTLLSPQERNPKVAPSKQKYDYEAYNPRENSYWDAGFKADLETGSHVSYAHLVLFGERKAKWAGDVGLLPVLGNRGPKDGNANAKSLTCPKEGIWTGVIVFHDGHYEYLKTTTPLHVLVETGGEKKPDNLYKYDDGEAGKDAILAFTTAMTDKKATIQFD